MPSRLLPRREESNSVHQHLPFTNDTVTDAEFDHQNDYGPNTVPRSRPIRASPNTSSILSSSYSQRNPIRSFAHQASSSAAEAPQYSSHGVRERTQELASYALDSEAYQGPRRRTSVVDSDFASSRHAIFTDLEGRSSLDLYDAEAITVDEDPETPETVIGPERRAGRRGSGTFSQLPSSALPEIFVDDNEETPLLPKTRFSRPYSQLKQNGLVTDAASSPSSRAFGGRVEQSIAAGREHLIRLRRSAMNPNNYTKDAVAKGFMASLQMSSAVFLGLLLNILDALSYGYILFPLGSPIFSQTGPDGISIFFVSCIVGQLSYSLGLSVFRGGVGSEMIEVVPFFHKMAYSIMARMEGESAEAIMATTITSYCLSSIVTGLIFLALGGFKLGNLVSFFPRHILIGCIGGVGFFLIVTGIEVSARLEGNLNYDMATLHKLFARDTVALWMLPLFLAIVILVMRRYIKSPVVLPAFFIGVFAIFYIIVKGILRLDLEPVRNAGWIFEKPEAGVPFYRFYSYFKFSQIDGMALVSTMNPSLSVKREAESGGGFSFIGFKPTLDLSDIGTV
ncbi:hypothetical protein DM02DRAFT_622563 [Periconia macrospinosa]|uniref:SLC26A/SulP transporter domain-containing protein n=1 Tax=Periconia macrospinosa TaxID=97972 RepID=A0A2V1EAZ4_9PLEO|nr:hypothetical protein DM02DRAFT_622563 [Periconia macrospinosa]